jgi:hypothetical protein
MMTNALPGELRAIQRFLREAAQTKAELRPDYARFKHLVKEENFIKWQVIRSLCDGEVYQAIKERAVRHAMIKVKREFGMRTLRRYLAFSNGVKDPVIE